MGISVRLLALEQAGIVEMVGQQLPQHSRILKTPYGIITIYIFQIMRHLGKLIALAIFQQLLVEMEKYIMEITY